MTNFFYRLSFAISPIVSARAVYYPSVYITDVLIAVNYALGDDDRLRIIVAYKQSHYVIIGRRIDPVVPHSHFEGRRPDKAKKIGLIDMLVRPAFHIGLGERDVRHYRV